MSFVNTNFFIFLIVSLIGYYLFNLLPLTIRKYQWLWLLVVSYYYYLSFGYKTFIFIIMSTLSTYCGAYLIGRINDNGNERLKKCTEKVQKKKIKQDVKKHKKIILVAILILNFGILGFVKYSTFLIGNVNGILNWFGGNYNIGLYKIILPMGISFYTFQSVSYLIDVYLDKYKAEKNIFKYALFVSYFPQIMQGPIGRFDRLKNQLFVNHHFDLRQTERAFQLITWGLCKKMIVADRTAQYVNNIFNGYEFYCGFYNVFGVLMYCAQLYADFSGGIDIVMGVSELFGIKLDQNFRQPFFSKSISEFWRRWHITLGTWMKDYVFYPFSLSKKMNHFGKHIKKIYGVYFGKTLPICLGNLLVFFLVGVWHGAAWKYIAYGMYNGIIIVFSSLMSPVYIKVEKFLHINVKSKGWKLFQMLRTFLLVNIGWYFDMAGSLRIAIIMIKRTFIDLKFHQFTAGGFCSVGMQPIDFAIVLAFSVVWLVVSCIKEQGKDVRDVIECKPLVLRWAIYLIMAFSLPLLGYIGKSTGFIYAQF